MHLCLVILILFHFFGFFFPECQISCFVDSCYLLQNRGPNWHNDRKLCQNQGADLVSIETVKEWNFLNDLIQNRNNLKRYNEWNIGLEKKGRNWTWVSGKPLTINKWKENQPSDDGDVAIMVRASSDEGKLGLQVTQRDQPHASICETRKGKMTTHLGKPGASSKPLSVRKVLSDCNTIIQRLAPFFTHCVESSCQLLHFSFTMAIILDLSMP